MEETHFLEMMRAIQPHVSGRPKRSVELMIQSADLLHCFHQYQEPALSACDIEQDSIDFEAMLTALQPVCTPPEAELINLILNFFRSRKIYSAYLSVSQQNPASASDSAQKTDYQTTSEHEQYQKTPYSSEAVSAADENRNHFPQTFSESSEEDRENFSASQPAPESFPERTGTGPAAPSRNNANTFRNLMENHALQSLLSPAQKENLNQINTLMQVMRP